MDKSDTATSEPDVRLSYLEQELRRKQEMGVTSLGSEGEGRERPEARGEVAKDIEGSV